MFAKVMQEDLKIAIEDRQEMGLEKLKRRGPMSTI